MLKYFLDNNLISTKQSGFKPGDSCLNPLLSITHDFFFHKSLVIRRAFI